MELGEQVELIFKLLYENKDRFISIYEIVESLNEKILRRDVERILTEPKVNCYLDEEFAMIEGFQTDTILYSLNLAGIALCEKAWKLNDLIMPKKPEIPFPHIFTSLIGYKIFEAFREEVVTEKSHYSDYSFLFENLKNDKFIQELKHMQFIKFLRENYNVNFAEALNQFKYSKNIKKLKLYSRIKKQIQQEN